MSKKAKAVQMSNAISDKDDKNAEKQARGKADLVEKMKDRIDGKGKKS
ncbi:hypothetical protein [Streptomyces sp. NPDC059080]